MRTKEQILKDKEHLRGTMTYDDIIALGKSIDAEVDLSGDNWFDDKGDHPGGGDVNDNKK